MQAKSLLNKLDITSRTQFNMHVCFLWNLHQLSRPNSGGGESEL
jgi:hypothetical protein